MVTVVTTLVEVAELLAETTVRGVELEGPEEVGGLLEVRTHRNNFVNQIVHREDTVLSENSLDLLVIHERHTLTVQLGITTLVHQFADSLEVGVTVGDVGFHETEHLNGGLVQTNKDSIVDLAETEKTEDLLHLGRNLVDTTNTDHNGKTTFTFNEEVTIVVSFSSLGNEIGFELHHHFQNQQST